MHIRELLRPGILVGLGLSAVIALAPPPASYAQTPVEAEPIEGEVRDVRIYEPAIEWGVTDWDAGIWYNANIEHPELVQDLDPRLLDHDIVISEGDGMLDLRPYDAPTNPARDLSLNMYNSLDVPARVIIPDLEVSFLVYPNTAREYEMSMLEVGMHDEVPYIVEPLEAPEVAVVEGSILDMLNLDTSYVVEAEPEPVYYERAVRGYW